MLGRSHVACAAAGWAVAAPTVAALFGQHLDPLGYVASLAVAAGSGVGPDIDHPGATISHTHWPVSKLVSELVHDLGGGHRKVTHWLTTGVLVGAVVTAAGVVWPRWTLAVVLGICGAWALRVTISRRDDPVFWAPTLAAAAGVAAYLWVPDGAWWVGLAVGFGWCAHIVCDWVCRGSGVPLFGPFTRERFDVGLFRIGGPVEHVIAGMAAGAVVVVGIWFVTA